MVKNSVIGGRGARGTRVRLTQSHAVSVMSADHTRSGVRPLTSGVCVVTTSRACRRAASSLRPAGVRRMDTMRVWSACTETAALATTTPGDPGRAAAMVNRSPQLDLTRR